MDKMIFKIDRNSVTEGDIVEVQWDCHEASKVELTIDNGYRSTTLPLDPTGTKRFRLNRSKGRTTLTISAWVNRRCFKKKLQVSVKPIPITHADTVDDLGKKMGALRQWWQRNKVKYAGNHGVRRGAWQSLAANKRIVIIALIILFLALLMARVAPTLFLLVVMGLIAYLLWVVWRR